MEDIYRLNPIICQKPCLGSWQELADTPLGKEANARLISLGHCPQEGAGQFPLAFSLASSWCFLGSHLSLNLLLSREDAARCLFPEPLGLYPAAMASTQSSRLCASASWAFQIHLRLPTGKA